MTKVQFRAGDLTITVEGDRKSIRMVDEHTEEPKTSSGEPINPSTREGRLVHRAILDGYFDVPRTVNQASRDLKLKSNEVKTAMKLMIVSGLIDASRNRWGFTQYEKN